MFFLTDAIHTLSTSAQENCCLLTSFYLIQEKRFSSSNTSPRSRVVPKKWTPWHTFLYIFPDFDTICCINWLTNAFYFMGWKLEPLLSIYASNLQHLVSFFFCLSHSFVNFLDFIYSERHIMKLLKNANCCRCFLYVFFIICLVLQMCAWLDHFEIAFVFFPYGD